MKHLEVVAVILIKDNRVFCTQRKDSGEAARKWEFPGGKVEFGETHQQALAREIYEELNTRISVGNFVKAVNHQYNTFAITMHAYLGTILEGSLSLSEHLDSKWLSIDELTSVEWAPADLPIVDEVRGLLSA